MMTTFKDLTNGTRFRAASFPEGDIFRKDDVYRSTNCPDQTCDLCHTPSWNAVNESGDPPYRVHFCPDIVCLRMTQMTIPTIHLNGTGKTALVQALCDASIAVGNAQIALGQCCPHGRDYYPQGDTAFGKALDEHKNRMKKLDEVRLELDEIITKIEESAL